MTNLQRESQQQAGVGCYDSAVERSMPLTCFLICLSLPPCMLVCCSYDLHSRGMLFQTTKDQIQPIAIDLLALAANAVLLSPSLGLYMAEHTALAICDMYQSPHHLWVSSCHRAY